jgi:chromosomal replication initiation ATPase DnaA
MGSVLASLHKEHKERQLRLRKAALKAVTEPAIIPLIETTTIAQPEPTDIPTKKFSNTFEATLYEVCRYYDVREKDVLSNRHMPLVIKCRHIIAYILYDITKLTNPQIGAKMDRDPTTIWYAISKIKSQLDVLQPEISELEARIALHKK